MLPHARLGPQQEEDAPEAAVAESVAAPATEPAATPSVQDTPEAVVEGPEPAPAAIAETAGPSSMEDVVAAEASVASVPETEMVAEPSAEEQSATAAAEAEDAGADTLGEGGGEAVLARAPTTEVLAPPTEDLTAEPDEEPAVDPAAISADAQGEMEALGASGGGELTGGGVGGGGGGAVEAEPDQPAPDVSNTDPAQAVAQAASLKPAQMLETLGGAEKAAANHVTKEHEKLAAQPPELEAGGGPEHVMRMTVFVTDMDVYLASRTALAEAWRRHMGRHYPAMALLGVSRLVDAGAMVEIEVTAALPAAPRETA